MKKTFELNDLDCAGCAAKMEDGISRLPGVIACRVNFITQKLTLEAEDERFSAVLDSAVKLCKKIEPDCVIKR